MKKTVNEIVEDIQKAQVDAGGGFLRMEEVKNMKVKELLRLLLPNNVEFNVKYNNKANIKADVSLILYMDGKSFDGYFTSDYELYVKFDDTDKSYFEEWYKKAVGQFTKKLYSKNILYRNKYNIDEGTLEGCFPEILDIDKNKCLLHYDNISFNKKYIY